MIVLAPPVSFAGTSPCPQAPSCVPEVAFTQAGDVDCNASVDLSDLALLLQAPFCDACATCAGKDANDDSRISAADVTALLSLLPQGLPTPTLTRTSIVPTATRTPVAPTATRTRTTAPTATPTVPPLSTSTRTSTATPTEAGPQTPTATRTNSATVTRTPTENTATRYSFAFSYGGPGADEEPLSRPLTAVLDADGDLWTADDNNRIVEFDADGHFLRQIGSSGSGDGQFGLPRGISFDGDGNIYVCDASNHRIQKFDAAGEYLTQWGGLGDDPGKLNMPACVFVRAGVVYVCDTYNHRVQRFNTNGMFLGEWGTLGDGPGEFDQPVDLALDSEGFIYVADFNNNRVQKFNAAFQHVIDIGKTNTNPSQLMRPTGLDVVGEKLYVTDATNSVRTYDLDGVFADRFGERGGEPGQISAPFDVAADTDGNIYVADNGNNRLQKLTFDFQSIWIVVDTLLDRFANPIDVAFSIDHGIMVSDTAHGAARIAFYRSDAVPDGSTFFKDEGNIGLLHTGAGVAAGPNGDIYLADSSNQSIAKFNSVRGFVKFFGSQGTGPGQFISPRGVAVDDVGNVFVVDGGNNRVQKFDANGVFLAIWGGFGTALGQFNAPEDIAVFGDSVYVTDALNNRVQIFDRSGANATQFGGTGDEDGQFMHPQGIAVDRDGYVYVVDQGNNRVQKFSPTGNFIVSFGGDGVAAGASELNGARGIAVANNGDVHIVNSPEKRILVYQAPQ